MRGDEAMGGVLVNNKHYTITIEDGCDVIVQDDTNRISFTKVSYDLKTTRATRFQAKKLFRKVIIKVLMEAASRTIHANRQSNSAAGL